MKSAAGPGDRVGGHTVVQYAVHTTVHTTATVHTRFRATESLTPSSRGVSVLKAGRCKDAVLLASCARPRVSTLTAQSASVKGG
jgi:hypothetical protein